MQQIVIPHKNSITKLIEETKNYSKHSIIHKFSIPINLYLVASKKISLKDIEYIHSKKEPLEQAQNYLERNLSQAKLIEENSTTLAAEKIKYLNNCAAITSKEAADIYGLSILAEKIQDKKNYTEFMVLE